MLRAILPDALYIQSLLMWPACKCLSCLLPYSGGDFMLLVVLCTAAFYAVWCPVWCSCIEMCSFKEAYEGVFWLQVTKAAAKKK